MFTKTSETEALLDAEIGAVLAKLTEMDDKKSEDYETLVKRVSELTKLKAEPPQRISPDTALVVAANLFGILAIINHERLHPITSKALSFVHKPR